MGGGKLQLSIKGDEDNYISNNPNLNFFNNGKFTNNIHYSNWYWM